MIRQIIVIALWVCVELIFRTLTVQAQEPLSVPGDHGTKTIPFRVLQQLVRGNGSRDQIRSDILPEQIEVMKKVEADRLQHDNEVHGLMGKLSLLPHKSRRLYAAAEQLSKERQDELHAVWLKVITSEQQAILRRRNRVAILQASLETSRTHHALLNPQESLDQLMTNDDYLSILEQPRMQDVMEITDEQIAQIEELQKLAQQDAMNTMRELLELVNTQHTALRTEAKTQHPESEARKQLQERTMHVLNEGQAETYRGLMSDGRLMQILERGGVTVDARERRLVGLPHGAMLDWRDDVQDGQTKRTIVLHNAFARPELLQELKLNDMQQQEIAKILEESSPRIIAEMELDRASFMERDQRRREAHDQLLKAHVKRVSAPAREILTESQRSVLEKERFRGRGLDAMRSSQVQTELNLTDDQSRLITEIVSRSVPQPERPLMKSSATAEVFRKQAEEYQRSVRENEKSFREFQQKQIEDVRLVLSDDQRAKFSELTGFEFPLNIRASVPLISQ